MLTLINMLDNLGILTRHINSLIPPNVPITPPIFPLDTPNITIILNSRKPNKRILAPRLLNLPKSSKTSIPSINITKGNKIKITSIKYILNRLEY